jgi:pSer/pThr/pTyr-binding forkhead associated (FHA) protein
MPNIKLKLPENEAPSQIALRGDHITIGRRPDNAIQIRDRTVSAHHAELLLEDGHYRLRDRGATNGTRVNGLEVTDYHLRESCRIDLGGVECEFHVSPVPSGSETEDDKLATRQEVNAAWRECEALRKQLDAAREELHRLRAAAAGDREALTNDYAKLAAQCHRQQIELRRRDGEIAVLQTGVRLLRRDRDNLQNALDEVLNAGISAVRNSSLPKPPPNLGPARPE